MGENQLLVDTDILIAYINRRAYRIYLENSQNRIYYSAITKKELLSALSLIGARGCSHCGFSFGEEAATSHRQPASFSFDRGSRSFAAPFYVTVIAA